MSVFSLEELQKRDKNELITIIGNYINDQEIWLNKADSLEKQLDDKNAEIERLTEELRHKTEVLSETYAKWYNANKTNAELQKQVDELKDICLDCPYKLKFDEIEKQAVKYTAKEIWEKAKAKSIPTFVNIDDNPRKDSSIFLSDLKNIVREKGVEVE